jgi:hypothetical protein
VDNGASKEPVPTPIVTAVALAVPPEPEVAAVTCAAGVDELPHPATSSREAVDAADAACRQFMKALLIVEYAGYADIRGPAPSRGDGRTRPAGHPRDRATKKEQCENRPFTWREAGCAELTGAFAHDKAKTSREQVT